MNRLSPHPLAAIYNNTTALVLATERLSTLPVAGVDKVIAWLDEAARAYKENELREPKIRYLSFEAYVVGLLGIARQTEELTRYAPDFDPLELEEAAALLVSAAIVRRDAAQLPIPLSSSPEGEEAATRHGWKTLDDTISDLKAYEDELVELGEAVLSGKPALLEPWSEDVDDSSFQDAADDVRRRLDFVAKHKDAFQHTAIDEPLLARGEALYRDSVAFFRGREGRTVPRAARTHARYQAFTLLLERTLRLQRILKAAHRQNQELREKIDGGYWRNLEKLARPRRKTKKDEA